MPSDERILLLKTFGTKKSVRTKKSADLNIPESTT